MNLKENIRECKKYHLILSTGGREFTSLQEIKNAQKGSFEEKYNLSLQKVTEEEDKEILKEEISKISTEKPKCLQELQQLLPEVKKCYSSFCTICSNNERYKQTILEIFETKKTTDIKCEELKIIKTEMVLEKFFNDYLEEVIQAGEEAQMKLKELIARKYEINRIKPIKDTSIQINITFREFFNGFRKRIVIDVNGKKMMYIIVRNPCDTRETIAIEGQEFKIKTERKNWIFEKIEMIDGKEVTYMTYLYTEEERISRSITLPSGKVIVLTSISDGLQLKGFGYGKCGGEGIITFKKQLSK